MPAALESNQRCVQTLGANANQGAVSSPLAIQKAGVQSHAHVAGGTFAYRQSEYVGVVGPSTGVRRGEGDHFPIRREVSGAKRGLDRKNRFLLRDGIEKAHLRAVGGGGRT